MVTSDPIADFINRLRTAGAVGKETLAIPYSNLKMAIATVLKKQGYIADVEKKGRKVHKTLSVTLQYDARGKHRISGAKRISRPSKRVYYGAGDIRPVRRGTGTLVLSTPQGVLTGMEAKKQGVGGEALFQIW